MSSRELQPHLNLTTPDVGKSEILVWLYRSSELDLWLLVPILSHHGSPGEVGGPVMRAVLIDSHVFVFPNPKP